MTAQDAESAARYPLRRGIGTVDIAVLSAEGLPTAELVTAVQARIDEQRPVTAASATVLAPQPLPVDVHAAVRLQGTTLPVVTAQLEQALFAFFATLVPGDLVVRSHLEAIISGMAGVLDRSLITPAANVQAVVDATRLQWPRLGQVTLEAM
ncbi:baseplate J/gp47 family protein [Oleidesulfovibrio sp.]|uniref:baseplate J/gp47 family protein n=1 Tax=Oleidesulfovibrio sp. TaxID=2909707 RepID=UPI003A8ABD24